MSSSMLSHSDKKMMLWFNYNFHVVFLIQLHWKHGFFCSFVTLRGINLGSVLLFYYTFWHTSQSFILILHMLMLGYLSRLSFEVKNRSNKRISFRRHTVCLLLQDDTIVLLQSWNKNFYRTVPFFCTFGLFS